jgi:hypothetical protein
VLQLLDCVGLLLALWQSQRASFYGFVGGKSIVQLWPLLTNPQLWRLPEPSFSTLERWHSGTALPESPLLSDSILTHEVRLGKSLSIREIPPKVERGFSSLLIDQHTLQPTALLVCCNVIRSLVTLRNSLRHLLNSATLESSRLLHLSTTSEPLRVPITLPNSKSLMVRVSASEFLSTPSSSHLISRRPSEAETLVLPASHIATRARVLLASGHRRLQGLAKYSSYNTR